MLNIEQNQNLRYLSLQMLPIKGPLSFQIADSICNQTLVNVNLLHLDLSHTSLQNDEFLIFGQSMKKSKSLLSVHLSGNNMSQNLKHHLLTVLKIEQSEENEDEDDINEFQDFGILNDDKKDELTISRQISPSKFNKFKRLSYISQKDSSLSVSGINQSKQIDTNKQKQDSLFQNVKSKGRFFAMPDDQIIFYRFLGHCEMKDSYKWKLSNFCPVCEKWQYLIIVYSQKIDASEVQAFQTQVQRQLVKKSQFHKQLIHHNSVKEMVEGFKLDVIINGSQQFIQQKQKLFVPLDSFVQKLEDNYLNHYQLGERLIPSDDHDIVHKKVRKQYINKLSELKWKDKKKLIDFLYQSQKMNKTYKDALDYIDKLEEKHILTDEDYNIQQFKGIDQHKNRHLLEKLIKLTSDHNALILSNKFLRDDKIIDLRKYKSFDFDPTQFNMDEEVYVYATMVPPGLHQIQIRSKRKYHQINDQSYSIDNYNQTKEKYQQMTLDIPKLNKNINVFYKKKKKRRVNRFFNKDKSILKNWKHDDEEVLEKMVENDFQRFKIARMIRNYQDTDIPDKFCTISKIDTAFIATNVELEKNDVNPDRDLNRAEFFEILVRLANEKYRKSGQTEKFSSAFKKLLKENIFFHIEPVMAYQEWREKYLWNLDVDDIFRVNAPAIRRLFNISQTQSFLKRYWTMQDCINLICGSCGVFGIPENLVKMCFVFSKMTVINENDDSSKYNKMVYVEFLEFIGRIAYLCKIPDHLQREIISRLSDGKEEIGFPEKLEYVLDHLLNLVNCKRKARESLKDQYDTESDYE